MKSVREETLKGGKWVLLQKFTMKPVTFVYGMLIARLITPAETGILALTGLFFAIAAQLQDCGFATSLLRKNERSNKDINTVFWVNIGLSFIFSAVLFAMSPWFAKYFNVPALIDVSRVGAIGMFLGSLSSVQFTLYSANLEFKKLAIIGVLAAFISMGTTLLLALLGFSYWSLVWSGIASTVFSGLVVWLTSSWKPSLVFSRASFQELFAFGGTLMLGRMIQTISKNVRSLIIGRVYTPADLALYDRGFGLASMPSEFVSSVLGGITLPIMVKIQRQPERLENAYFKYIELSCCLTVWACLTMAALAAPGVWLLYGQNWLFSIPYVEIFGIAWAFVFLTSQSFFILLVKGAKRSILFMQIVNALVILGSALIGVQYSPFVMGCAVATSYCFLAWFNLYVVQCSINISVWAHIKTVYPFYIFGALAATCAWGLCQLNMRPGWQLSLGFLCSILIYFSCLHLTRNSAWNEYLKVLREKGVFVKMRKLAQKLKLIK